MSKSLWKEKPQKRTNHTRIRAHTITISSLIIILNKENSSSAIAVVVVAAAAASV